MKLKLDENLSRHLKPVLKALGHDVLTTAGEDLLSRPDSEIARAAITEERMLLTLDVEFGDLRKYPPGSHPRHHPVSPALHGAAVGQPIYRRFPRVYGFEQTRRLRRRRRTRPCARPLA